MAIDFSKIIATSNFPGFQNYSIVYFSGGIVSQTLVAGGFVSLVISTPLNNTNAISQVQIQFAGLSNNFLIINGTTDFFPNVPTPNYQVQSQPYYSGGNLNILTVVANNTGSSLTIPTITINVHAFLFIAPF